MRLSYTLTSYFGRHFVFWLFSVFVAVLAILELFDFVELLRRSSGKKAVTMEHVVQMTLLKLPHLIHEVLPFIILFAAMLSFWRLARCRTRQSCAVQNYGKRIGHSGTGCSTNCRMVWSWPTATIARATTRTQGA